MRSVLFLPLLLLTSVAHAAAPVPAPAAFAKVFELAGIRLLCEQTEPLLQRGVPAAQQAQLSQVFTAEQLCGALAKQLAPGFTAAQLQTMESMLESPLAKQFTAAERAVGDDEKALSTYREQLASRPPRAERLALVQRLDNAAQTTTMAALLRYEVGKTQALLALKARGESIDEATLTSKTQAQAEALRQSSAQGVEAFMLFAYRQTPSDQLGEYAALYEQAPLSQLLKASVQAFPAVFAERRAALK